MREDSAYGRDDTELHVTLAAGRHELGDDSLVDRRHRQHQPVGCQQRRAFVAELGRHDGPVGTDHGGVDVGEELELPTDGAHEIVPTDDHDSLCGRETPPDEPCEPAEEDRRDDGGGERPDGSRRLERRDGSELKEEGEPGDGRDRPDDEERQLVDREMPERAVIPVVEPVELRRENPGGEVEEHGERRLRARAEQRQGGGDRGDGADVRQRQHPAAQRVSRAPSCAAAAQRLVAEWNGGSQVDGALVHEHRLRSGRRLGHRARLDYCHPPETSVWNLDPSSAGATRVAPIPFTLLATSCSGEGGYDGRPRGRGSPTDASAPIRHRP